jgi:hypothetical protein
MMNMIDVMKRLAELDSANPNIIKESMVDECGIMPGMEMESPSMMPGRPSTPATINMTAGSGEELGNLLKDIMSLAGMNSQHAEEPAVVAEPQTLEPVIGDETPADTMRGVIDRLNPMAGDDDGMAGLDRDHDGDHDMDDHDMEKDQEDEEETDEGQYDNSPADPNKKNEFDANEFARRENQPGQGDRMDGTSPKAYADMNEAVSDLFAQYKKFIGESEEAEEDEDMEEGIEDRLKDLDPKNPVNIPAYKRKAASGDSADAARNTKEGATEKFDPLKHVKNPTQGEKDAAKDVKRGSYADRAAMLRSAEADGRLTVDQARANKKERMRNDYNARMERESTEMESILKLSGLK